MLEAGPLSLHYGKHLALDGVSIAVAEGAVIEGEIKVTSGAPPVTFQEKRQP